ncbi:glycosyltransferase [Beijerinckia indica]|uniref:Glycosyl transferase group 1 n=1 Tax=Beijerinckia indica subsp. indica (strain ATCC 9039 / DSM 1715 / NCIMB 8712) TaxID=395963 RepID=B2IH73_BEII9|nr:glycosyltransferase [Beijerinckia indica]ACB94486.1 glycosyl transferase group 1 [Beijerinckia indica subsp. indica ATCC 9039]
MRVAVVHDWLYVIGGAERVLKGILRCYPQADVHCLFDLLPPADRRKIGYEVSKTSFLQKMPGIRHHQFYLPLMPIAIEQTDLRNYDLIISSSYAVAKGIITGPDQLHVSYVHSPMRYAWDLQQTYLKEARLEKGIQSVFVRVLMHWMRIWDQRTVNGVDAYIANSRFVARRIHKLYGRDAEVINPPVTVPTTFVPRNKERFFLTASRLVPYKNTRALVEAFRFLPDEKLVVVGSGPELPSLKAIAGSNVQFLGFVEDSELRDLMQAARAFLFGAQEDFGIVVVEAQAQGTPIIALGKGGARETVIAEGPTPTGLFFDEADPAQVAVAVNRFIQAEANFLPVNCHRNALRFSEDRFDRAFKSYVDNCWEKFEASLASPAPSMVPQIVASRN